MFTHSLAEKIRYQLSEHHLTINSLAEKCQVPVWKIKNILYGKSKCKKTLQRMTEVLGLSSSYFFEDYHPPAIAKIEKNDQAFNPAIYSKLSSLISDLLIQGNVLANAPMMEKLTSHAYDAYSQDQLSYEEVTLYIKGMIKMALITGLLRAT